MIRIKEAYRLLRRNKRKSIITITKIFIPAEIARTALLNECISYSLILEFMYSTTTTITLIICFAFFTQHVMFPVLFVEFFFPSSNERIVYALCISLLLLLLLFTYFVREEKRDEVDFEL